MTAPTDLTPLYNNFPIEHWTTPHEAGQFKVALTDAEAKSLTLAGDLNFCTLTAVGEDLYANVSYTDGTNEAPGNLLAVSNDPYGRRIELTAGVPWPLPQGLKFNKIYVTRQSGASGTATLVIVPGRMRLNTLTHTEATL